MTFHLMFVHIIFSSVFVAEWPPLGKELPTRLTIVLCFLCILTVIILVIFRFGVVVVFFFWGGGAIWVMIAPVPGHCILNTCTICVAKTKGADQLRSMNS